MHSGPNGMRWHAHDVQRKEVPPRSSEDTFSIRKTTQQICDDGRRVMRPDRSQQTYLDLGSAAEGYRQNVNPIPTYVIRPIAARHENTSSKLGP